jgi:hypothetical protein
MTNRNKNKHYRDKVPLRHYRKVSLTPVEHQVGQTGHYMQVQVRLHTTIWSIKSLLF